MNDHTLQWKNYYEARMAAALSAFALLVALDRMKKGAAPASERPPEEGTNYR